MTPEMEKIVELFDRNVRGKKSVTPAANKKHDGKGGHWLEKQMGVKPNAANKPDLFGYEMKNDTTSKTSFGDWSPNYRIFKDSRYNIDRDTFLKIFGKPNIEKGGRYSWSGEPCPKVNSYNRFGQRLYITPNNDIVAKYSFRADKRRDKSDLVPRELRADDLVLAIWEADSMKKKVENKFNQNGWFKCIRDADGVYTEIVFGEPMNFEKWISDVKKGLIFFDSGMFQGNPRQYSQWRANNNYWESLIISKY